MEDVLGSLTESSRAPGRKKHADVLGEQPGKLIKKQSLSITGDWLDMLSPPIVPPSQQPTEQPQESSASVSMQGEEDLSAEEDEEVLTLLYDPCLNCYFDPQTGKYYELV
ncbi:Protein CFAP20DC [Lemmus lemmus]